MQNISEKRKLKNKQIQDAFKSTGIIVERIKNPRQNADEIEIRAYKSAAIRYFEICYELFWNYLKLILEEDFGIFIASPKPAFQEALKNTLLNDHEFKNLLNMADDRNTTSHIYNKILAKEVFLGIDKHLDLMKKIVIRINI